MLAELIREHHDEPVQDRIVVLRGLHWSDYQRMLELRGESPVPRFAYLEGQLEITTPSLPHESIKSRIGRLVEVWCLEKGVEFSPVGSWTLEKKEVESGLEPDESYVFGPVPGPGRPDHTPGPERPDLAIEVVWISGGIEKLDVYAKLGVREVWFWRRGRITVHLLRGDAYVDASGSECLPGIDLDELASFIDRPTASQAMREYSAALLART
jgi:Uma2 family endonuclease